MIERKCTVHSGHRQQTQIKGNAINVSEYMLSIEVTLGILNIGAKV